MRALVLAYGDGRAASTVFRYRALQMLWSEKGHRLEIIPLTGLPSDIEGFVSDFDVIINQKGLMAASSGRRILAAGRPLLFDFDDAIWTRPGRPYSWWTQWRTNRRIRFWLRRSQAAIVANHQLAAFAGRYIDRVHVVPMALDLDLWRPVGTRSAKGVTLGWTGGPGNLRHLEALSEVLKGVLRRHPEARLKVLCGQRPHFDFDFEHLPFTSGQEVSFVGELDIGLLPLLPEPYSLSKSPIKALQYLSCAVPVVGNVRGATAEILTPANSLAVASDEEWTAALQKLIQSPDTRAKLGQAGREHVERHHDIRRVSDHLLHVLSTVS